MIKSTEVIEGERLEILYVRLSDAVKWERNPKIHDIPGIIESIMTHGFRDAPIWDSTLGGLVGGNGRLQALEEMEAATDLNHSPPRGILMAEDDGEWCVPVQFGIDAESKTAAEAFALDHNNLTLGGNDLGAYEKSLIWDDTYLEIIDDVRGENGHIVSIHDDDLEAIRRARQLPLPMEIEEISPVVRMDKAEILLEEWKVEKGDIWQIGEHRLMCDDAMDGNALDDLLDGKSIAWMWTDPPYGVNYEGRTKDKLVMEGDETTDLDVLLAATFANLDERMDDGCPIYLCHPSGRLSVLFGRLFQEAGWLFHETLIWVKDVMVMGHSDYHYQHEPIIYGWKKGAKRPWFGGRTRVTTFNVARPSRSERHPTIKPLDLIIQQLDNSTEKGAIGLDPFIGSGSTMLAAHFLGRVCYAMEIEPKYCAVTLERMKDVGIKGKKL